MGLVDSLKKEKFVIIAETDPPKGAKADSLIETADLLKGRVDALLVTDMPSAVMKMSPVAACSLLKRSGHETICNISCRDRNILALQSDVLGAAALGIENFLISDGEDISFGDHPRAMQVREIMADDLLGISSRLKEGADFAGNRLESSPIFYTGAMVNPGAAGEEFEQEIARLQIIEKEGTSFLVTPPLFDAAALGEFINKIREKCSLPVIASTIVLKSVATARFLNLHVEGVTVPDSTIDRLYSAGDKFKESIMISADLVREFRNVCQGVNIMAMGWEARIPAILDAAWS